MKAAGGGEQSRFGAGGLTAWLSERPGKSVPFSTLSRRPCLALPMASIQTTMAFYVDLDVDEIAEDLFRV